MPDKHAEPGGRRSPGLTYADSGVSIQAGEEAVQRIRSLVQCTHGPEVLAGIGGFAGVFRPDLSGIEDPVLVSCTDGVGTKLKVACESGRHDSVGIDNVAMSVNDLLCQGARPLFFLDYIGTSALDPAVIEKIVAGVVEGCRRSGCALLGGEMAELPGMYRPGEYDLVGFAVGIADRSRLVTGARTARGDALIGLASSGLHSNGYSLARKVLLEVADLALDSMLPRTNRPVVDELLEPTRIYARVIADLLAAIDVRGIAHITGGGLPGNLPRALREDLGARLVAGSWHVPPVFRAIADLGPVEEEEMLRTFNMGLGMVVVSPPEEAGTAVGLAREAGVEAWIVGEVIEAGDGGRFVLDGSVWQDG